MLWQFSRELLSLSWDENGPANKDQRQPVLSHSCFGGEKKVIGCFDRPEPWDPERQKVRNTQYLATCAVYVKKAAGRWSLPWMLFQNVCSWKDRERRFQKRKLLFDVMVLMCCSVSLNCIIKLFIDLGIPSPCAVSMIKDEDHCQDGLAECISWGKLVRKWLKIICCLCAFWSPQNILLISAVCFEVIWAFQLKTSHSWSAKFH